MDPSTSKTPAADDVAKGSGSANGGFRPTHNAGLVTVQPPRREDLQPSYAQVLVGDEGHDHGWYGSMSKSGPLMDQISQRPKLIVL